MRSHLAQVQDCVLPSILFSLMMPKVFIRHPPTGKMLSNVMWQTQVALHGQSSNAILPALLVAAASVLVAYNRFTDEQTGDPIKHFLGLIAIQMIPSRLLANEDFVLPRPSWHALSFWHQGIAHD